MAKVLVKHEVTIDIVCDENFEDSVFHLAAYHKLHYLQYLSVFQDPHQWEEYLQTENSVFDYLFDEYEKTTSTGQVRVTRVRDGPVIKAIKSHLRGFKIVDECLDNEGYTALHRAAQGGNVVAVKHFLKGGANASLKSPEGFDLLTLSIWYAIKYRPRLNFHKESLLTGLEVEFASFTAGIILQHLTKEGNQVDIGCDYKRKNPTLLHLAATRGMWRFIYYLFIHKANSKVFGLNANCPTKHGITPMYLAKIYGGGDCNWDNPWCKVVQVLLQNGAIMEQFPTESITEYFVIVNALFHDIPERFHKEMTLDSLLTLEEACGQDECKKAHLESSQTTNLIKEILQGTNACGKRERLLKDIAFSIDSKQQSLDLKTCDFLSFASGSINDLKLLILSLVSSKNADKESCEPLRSKSYTSKTLRKLDMCSRETEISLNGVSHDLKRKYKAYETEYKALEKEISFLKKVIDSQDHESQRYKDLNKESYLFTRNYLCKWQTVTFKYTQLKFIIHALISWHVQVHRIGYYPSISRFAAKRIQKIFLGENRKEFVKFIIALSKGHLPKEYEGLRMLRFQKPPLFDNLSEKNK